ncbi:hypothetical protein E2562_024914 [Oryza meyeriana var. granulata]|uniref:Uncharacterized protein n=1 Tax=Oryza meyeriana var. granulata TaxID=110450 RepID=A0A6G1DN01_9ORYZ|nr:hypothetical protein E2562_024914 [Oryza meyeriana var. granulata]
MKEEGERADKMGMEINLVFEQQPDLASSLQPINWVEYRRSWPRQLMLPRIRKTPMWQIRNVHKF